MNWKEFLTETKTELIITILSLVILLTVFPIFLSYVEARTGIILSDPLLNYFEPVDLTWFTFGFIYLGLITAIINFIPKPDKLTLALQSYSVMLVFRITVMYLTPLDAPEKLIALNDPFVQLFGSGQVLTRDLFFSGHTATLFLLYLITDKKWLKFIFLFCTILVGIFVLLQHVHYTVDVIAAPVFAYTSYRIVLAIKSGIVKINS